MRPALAILIPARNESDRVGETVRTLREAFSIAPPLTGEAGGGAAASMLITGFAPPPTGSPRPRGEPNRGSPCLQGEPNGGGLPKVACDEPSTGEEKRGAAIVVLDDGSTDGTAEQALQAGAQVVRVSDYLPRTGSKGDALWLGWQLVEAPVYLFLDADLGASARHAVRLLTPVQLHQADMTIGVLPPAGRTGGFGTVVQLSRLYLYWRTGRRFRAPLSGQRAITRKLLMQLRGFAPGYGLELGLTLDACLLNARILEIETPFEHRSYGRTLKGFGHRARQLRDVIKAMGGIRHGPIIP